MRKPWLLLLLLCSLGTAYCRELPTLIPRKVLFGNPEQILPQISPDGKTLRGSLLGMTLDAGRALPDSAAAGHCVTTIQSAVSGSYSGRKIASTSSTCKTKMAMKTGISFRFLQAETLLRSRPDAGRIAGTRDCALESISRSTGCRPQQARRFHDAYLLNLNSAELKLLAENPGDVEYHR